MSTFSKSLFKIALLTLFSFFFILFSPHAEAAVIQKPANNLGLVGYWSLNEGNGTIAHDFSGAGNNGTLTNGPTWVDGKRGNALNFDGSNDYVDLNNSLNDFSFIQNTLVFTESAWIKIDNLDGRLAILSSVGTGSEKGSWFNWETYGHDHPGLGYGDHSLELVVTDGNTTTGFWHSDDNATISDNNWHHIALVGNGSTVTFYVDGLAKTTTQTTSFTPSSGDSTRTMLIGDINYSTPPPLTPFDGLIDDVRIYNRTLSASEVAALYGSGSAKIVSGKTTKINSSQNNKVANGLVGLWSFDGPDMSTTTAYDRSTQGHNGTLQGGPTPTIGKIGQALYFDGVNDYVTTASGLSLGNIASINFWIKPAATINSSSANWSLIQLFSNFWYFSTGAATGLCSNEYLTIGVGDGTRLCLTDGGSIDTNWHMLSLVWNGSSYNLYIDTVQKTTESGGNGQATEVSADIVEIGALNAGAIPFQGIIDDVRLYSRSLSAAEVLQLYNLGR